MARKTQKANVDQLMELARVLLSIVPKLDLTKGDVLQQVDGAKHLKEILRLVFQVDPKYVDISRLKSAFCFRFALEARRYLEQEGYEIVETQPEQLGTQNKRSRQYCRLERELAKESDIARRLDINNGFSVGALPPGFDYVIVKQEEVAWMPGNPFVPGTLAEDEMEQWRKLGEFSEMICKETQGWARAMYPTLELTVPLLFDHSKKTEEYPFSSLSTRVSNKLRIQREGSGRRLQRRLAVGKFRSRDNGPIVFARDSGVYDRKLGILRLIIPN